MSRRNRFFGNVKILKMTTCNTTCLKGSKFHAWVSTWRNFI